jgi:hypothetical protein
MRRGRVARREYRETLARLDRVADRHVHVLHRAVDLGHDLVLHLHGLQDDQRLTRRHRIVGIVPDGNDGGGKGRQDRQVGHAAERYAAAWRSAATISSAEALSPASADM